MEFHDAANFLFDLRRYPPRAGTDATAALLSHLDDPHESYRAVQVAGSNGKGSTARMVERVLREAGLDVGLYTSPHLDDVRERVRINGRKLTDAALVEFVEAVRPYVTEQAAAGDPPTFFETLTALACWAFERADVDVAILEVGIGGRYDATSVVDPVAGAVTTVALEHTDLLGDTVEEIARDKAHVAPDDAPLVTGATGDALDAIRSATDDVFTVGTDSADSDLTVDYHGRDSLEGTISLEGTNWGVETKIPLLGAHQARNAGVAAALCRQVADVADDDLARGLRNAHWPGRFEVMSREPLVVLDGAHNPGGCAALAETLDSFDYDDLHVVVGAMSDKDHRGMAEALPDAATVVACEPDLDRAEADDVLAAAVEAAMPDAGVSTRSDVAGAFERVREAAGEDDCVVVTGSLYCVAEARADWTRPYVPKQVDAIPEARETLERAHVTEAGAWRMRGKAVHRVLQTRVQPRQAQYLKEEMLSLGGECAVSGLNDQDRENLDAVLMGTLAQFKRLAGKLDGQPYGLAPLADDLRAALGIEGHGRDDDGYPWADGTAVMGILNVTPDSFHDGGEFDAVADAIDRAEEMVANGVDIVDIGGESTRPGADPVPVEEEIDRVVPVIEAVSDLDAWISIDTRKAAVGRAALDAGADILNDVSGLEDPEMRLLAAERDVPVVVMHSIETPVDPDTDIEYDDVVGDVIDDLTERILLAEKAGLDREQIIVDPGLGFGKSSAESFELLGRIDEFAALGCPVLVGHSHKSLFELVGREAGDRLQSTVAATALAAERGADIVRVHDVRENVAAVRTVAAADDPERFEE
ncbi:dihydropteroate synthase [Halorientalis marina]|uniref:dihydropteroate synthase n=1 Tax=Halorientalis marina TaxID=2931976 RepID=UPI001FF51DCA|nr:dihydropteroate synthase [Halorientalis marina]